MAAYDLDLLTGYGASDLPVPEPAPLPDLPNGASLSPVPSLVPAAPAGFLGLATTTWLGIAVAGGLALAAYKFGLSQEDEAADDDDDGDRYESRRSRLGATEEYDDEDEDEDDDEDDDRGGMRPNRTPSRAEQLAAEITRLQQIHGSPR